jgi:hypothetical protein
MRMTLSVFAFCVLAVTSQAQGPQSTSRYGITMSSVAGVGDGLCASWGSDFPPRDGATLSPTKMFAEATKHAWVFGFVVGAAHMSETRLARVDADTVDAWMDTYCAAHPRTTIGNAAATLVAELARQRQP